MVGEPRRFSLAGLGARIQVGGEPVDPIRHLYIHIPFCHRICPYCAFYKHQPGRAGYGEFVDAILEHASMAATRWPADLSTIYLGGGTPSMLPESHLSRLLAGLRRHFGEPALAECTLEANPRTFDGSKAEAFLAGGVTRVSLGIQSWQPDLLRVLGRDHSPEDAERAVECLRRAGCGNLNIDLMFSVPGQTERQWFADLEQTARVGPEHISCYNLTYEEDTAFFERFRAGEYAREEETDAVLFYRAEDFLEARGYAHYETSNYARPGFDSRHNLAYWQGEDYLGLGPGAVSTVGGRRWKNVPDTARYTRLALSGGWDAMGVEEENLTPRDLANERVAMLLRTGPGLPEERLPAGSLETVDRLIEEGLMAREDRSYRLTREGRALADPIAAELIDLG